MNNFERKYQNKIKISTQFKNGFGWQPDKIVREDAIYSSIFKEKLPPFDWRPYLPAEKERQYNSQFCVNFSYTNCLETAHKKEYNNEINLSDRWSAVKSKTALNGNTLKNVWNAGNNFGNILEEQCKWLPEWLEEPERYWDEIQKLPESVDSLPALLAPNFSFVDTDLDSLKTALAHSPLNIGVMVGETWQEDIITPPQTRYGGHAVELAYIDDCIYLYDSYPPFLRKMSLDYPILMAGSFRPLPEDWRKLNQKKCFFQKVASYFNEIIR